MRWMFLFTLALISVAAADWQVDVIKSAAGDIRITFIGHGTLMLAWNGKTIHIDPVSDYADYTKLAKADIVLVTHEHSDHLDIKAIDAIKKENTQIVYTKICAEKLPGGVILNNGEQKTVAGILIQAVPAYNIEHKRSNGAPFHPKGNGNGYVLTLGDKKIYIAGDTEAIPEMKNLQHIDIAFLPMNLPYTMTPEMTAAAARMVQPKILYPYHYGDTDVNKLPPLLVDDKNIEIRIRKLN